LKSELYLCGLFSQLDILLNELMPTVLQRIPLPERVLSAIGGRRGVYWAALDMAFALEAGDAVLVSQRGIIHGTPPSQVNKALLRVMSGLSSITTVQPLL
jgi:c-di-GMP-related signal transduction protein